MCPEVCSQVRPEELTSVALVGLERQASARQAAIDLLDLYTRLSADNAHILGEVLSGQAPQVWTHYPADDACDDLNGYQWFYHSHSQSDRPQAAEHGHFHVFARKAALSRWLNPTEEKAWHTKLRVKPTRATTRHLFCLGLDAKGVPNTLFTVNSWVTGDAMASAPGTLRLIEHLNLATGYPGIDRLIASAAVLCRDELAGLMEVRDRRLERMSAVGPGVLDDGPLEILSETKLDLDAIFGRLFEPSP
jgi:hypothetical protein